MYKIQWTIVYKIIRRNQAYCREHFPHNKNSKKKKSVAKDIDEQEKVQERFQMLFPLALSHTSQFFIHSTVTFTESG